jgi:pimeloyl-ACP methyl ester carboxylesterase
MRRQILAAALAAIASVCAVRPALAAGPYGVELQGFDYPYPLHHYAFVSQGESLQMAYMDVAPTVAANGRVVVLMHGKNFCGATWEHQIATLARAGYRVVVPDQVGFCASTKPAHYQYSFQQLVRNTDALLKSLGVPRATLVAHSTGGMIATRYALMFPQAVEQLVLVDPLGLEDWQAKGVPPRTVDEWTRRELGQTAQAIRDYERKTYYVGEWQPAYERWVDMLAGLQQGPGRELVARNSALIYDMIQTQPVVHEFALLKVPTVLMIGTRDTTAIGSDVASPEVKARIGHYDQLGPLIAGSIPGARLVEFQGLGHAPQIQSPDEFDRRLLEALAARPAP